MRLATLGLLSVLTLAACGTPPPDRSAGAASFDDKVMSATKTALGPTLKAGDVAISDIKKTVSLVSWKVVVAGQTYDCNVDSDFAIPECKKAV